MPQNVRYLSSINIFDTPNAEQVQISDLHINKPISKKMMKKMKEFEKKKK